MRRAATVAAVTVASALFPVAASADTFPAVADTYVDSSAPGTAFGTRTTLRTDGSPVIRIYLRFDLSAVEGTVTQAVLRLQPTASLNRGIEVRPVADTTWPEATTTFTGAPAVGAIVATSAPITAGTPLDVDVTPAVAGGGPVSLAVTDPSTTAVAFASREGGAATAPRLEVTIAPGEPTPPGPPTGVRAGSIAPREATVTWLPVAGAVSYAVERDGTGIATVPGTAFVDTAVAPGSTHSYTVRSIDQTATASEPSAPATATTDPVTLTTLNPTADAYVSAATPLTPFGLLPALRVDGSPDVRSLLRFDLSGLGDTIERATLRVRATSASTRGYEVRATTGGWDEATVTYATAPAGGAVEGASGRVEANTTTSVDVTGLIRRRGSGDLMLTTPSTTALALTSRESATSPELVVETRANPRVVAAGDIACDPIMPSFNGGLGTATVCRQLFTSDLSLSLDPDLVVPLGDTQYEQGTLAQFLGSYELSWGRQRPISRPTIGNHEQLTANGAGYFDYFGVLAGPRPTGWYSYDYGEWHVVVLNSYCPQVVSCAANSAQESFLRTDLANSSARCTLAVFHHPRFSSGEHNNVLAVAPLWQALYDAGADLVLNGHDHNYERFAPQDGAGNLDTANGVREIVVGTGGRSLRAMDPPFKPNSEVFVDDVYGVGELTLRPTGYDVRFVAEGGATVDSVSDVCH